MAHVFAYLRFNGNCQEAMEFYNRVLGGDLSITKYAGSTLSDKVPEEVQDRVLHAMLKAGSVTLYGTDTFGEHTVSFGNQAALDLECDSEEMARDIYGKLSAGGKILDPLSEPFWGGLYGQFEDKFGMTWMTVYQKQEGGQ